MYIQKEKKERRKKNTCQTSSVAAKFMLVSSVESNVKAVARVFTQNTI